MSKEKASKSNNYHYNKSLKLLARELRNSMTKAEVCLWKYKLKGNQMEGYTFLRQRSVLDFIADFMCKELLLIIEIDGLTHQTIEQARKDKKRDKTLAEVGFTTLRFSDWEVLNRINEVANTIEVWIKNKEIA